jgi:hypothetical protein
MGIRTPDLLHAIENPLGSLACDAPTGVSGSDRHASGRGLRPSKSAADLQDAAPASQPQRTTAVTGIQPAVQARPVTLAADGWRPGRRSTDGQMIFQPARVGLE